MSQGDLYIHYSSAWALNYGQRSISILRDLKNNIVPAIFTIDVEDWFHILDIKDAPDISRWDSLLSHVEKKFREALSPFFQLKPKP